MVIRWEKNLHIRSILHRFHQVDSEDLTIAVNFWWQSDMVSGMKEHMDGYYLRRIMKSTTSQGRWRLLYSMLSPLWELKSLPGNLSRWIRLLGQMIDFRSQFYQNFYSVFDDQCSAMDAFLNGKETCACQAFNNVLAQFLGVNIDGS